MNNNIELPIPPNQNKIFEHAVYSTFIRNLHHVPNSKMEIKILTSIQYAADQTNSSDAYVAKMLVDMGLRADRIAFPQSFIDHVENTVKRSRAEGFGLNAAYKTLFDAWSHGRQMKEFERLANVCDMPKSLEPVYLH